MKGNGGREKEREQEDETGVDSNLAKVTMTANGQQARKACNKLIAASVYMCVCVCLDKLMVIGIS